MDFEEQLERAEKSPYPSLVGASVKSADDLPHNNYIHPEKYTGTPKKPAQRRSVLNLSIGASLDDLISEGALLGSDEDFERFLDDTGNVRSDAKYVPPEDGAHQPAAGSPAPPHKPASSLRHEIDASDVAVLSPVDSVDVEAAAPAEALAARPLAELDNFSTPNLSEYQMDRQIESHDDLVSSVKLYDLSRLPSATDAELRCKLNEFYPATQRVPKNARSHVPHANASFSAQKLDFGENAQVVESDSMHAPYFQSDERLSSRSRSRASDRSAERNRSRSRSAIATHLARGDSYKSTHDDLPSKYELPADMRLEEEEVDERRSRQSRPTMGDSIAAAEARKVSVTKDPSLVTTGDYTNFNADASDLPLVGDRLYSLRSESSTNYLRSISRSRSRKPASADEKNNATSEELAREGALVSDDPYSQVENLDNMLQKVLNSTPEKSPRARSVGKRDSLHGLSLQTTAEEPSEPTETPTEVPDGVEGSGAVDDVPAETKVAEARVQQIDESAPTVTAADVHVNVHTEASHEVSKPQSGDVEQEKTDVSAEERVHEADEQIKAEAAPVVTALDIHVSDQAQKESGNEPEAEEVPLGETKEDALSETSEAQETATPSEQESAQEASEIKATETAEEAPAKTLVDTEEVAIESEKPDEITAEEAAEKPNLIVDSDQGILNNTEEPIQETEVEIPKTEDAETEESGTAKIVDAATEEGKEETAEGEADAASESTGVDKTDLEEVAESKEREQEVTTEEKDTSKEDTSKENTDSADGLASEEPAAEAPAEEPAKEEEPAEEEEFDVSPEELRKHLESLPIYLFTSLAGGMQIISRTNRLATILQANGVKFEYRDLGTDEEAKKIWRRYAQGQTLPGVVRGDDFIGNWERIEEVNEDYMLKSVLYETL